MKVKSAKGFQSYDVLIQDVWAAMWASPMLCVRALQQITFGKAPRQPRNTPYSSVQRHGFIFSWAWRHSRRCCLVTIVFSCTPGNGWLRLSGTRQCELACISNCVVAATDARDDTQTQATVLKSDSGTCAYCEARDVKLESHTGHAMFQRQWPGIGRCPCRKSEQKMARQQVMLRQQRASQPVVRLASLISRRETPQLVAVHLRTCFTSGAT